MIVNETRCGEGTRNQLSDSKAPANRGGEPRCKPESANRCCKQQKAARRPTGLGAFLANRIQALASFQGLLRSDPQHPVQHDRHDDDHEARFEAQRGVHAVQRPHHGHAQPRRAYKRGDDDHRQRQHDGLVQPGHDLRQRAGQFDLPQQLARGGAKGGRGLDQGIAACDAYAAEHLEIMTRDASAVAARIRNAGAIFVGDYSPVSLGDYCAGSNHVLPTSGTAAFSSGLNVTTFLRAIQVVMKPP